MKLSHYLLPLMLTAWPSSEEEYLISSFKKSSEDLAITLDHKQYEVHYIKGKSEFGVLKIDEDIRNWDSTRVVNRSWTKEFTLDTVACLEFMPECEGIPCKLTVSQLYNEYTHLVQRLVRELKK